MPLETMPRLAIGLWLTPDPLKSRAKLLPRHDRIDLDQRVLLGLQTRVTVRKVEETHLRHHCIPTANSFPHDTEVQSHEQFLEVPSSMKTNPKSLSSDKIKGRVLHVTPYLDASAGGPPVVVERLVAEAATNGYEATILTTAKMTTDGGRKLKDAQPGMIMLPSQRAIFDRHWRAQIKAAISAADLVHLHTMWSPLAAVAARQSIKKGVPYILSPHGMLDPYSTRQKWWKKRLYLSLVERRTIRGAARLLFTAEDERRLAEGLTGPMPSAVIALGADRPPASLAILRKEFLDQHPDLQNRKCAIFLGRLHEKKRPEIALRAFEKIKEVNPDFCLLIAGTGEEEQALHALSDTLGLGDVVRFLGFVKGREKWQALAGAKVFLLPSQQENFAIALAEALHAGLPALITGQVNIWREVVEAGAGKVLDPMNLDASLSALCLELLMDDKQQTNASRAAQALADKSFDWCASAKRTYALYDQIRQED
jgi:glycosyltransferase involved in cell wall biosynthesis